MNTDQLAEFAELTRTKRELDKQLKEINGQLASLEEALIEQFAAANMQSVNANGATVYVNHKVSARVIDGKEEEALALLDDEGLADIAKRRPNAQSLAAAVRERQADGDLPDSWTDVFQITNYAKLGCRLG